MCILWIGPQSPAQLQMTLDSVFRATRSASNHPISTSLETMLSSKMLTDGPLFGNDKCSYYTYCTWCSLCMVLRLLTESYLMENIQMSFITLKTNPIGGAP